MPIGWTESDILKLINLYSQFECLRNPCHCDYKNKLCRYEAYKEIVNSMNIVGLTVSDCIKRITDVKTQYCYELSKISASIACEKSYKPKAIWFPIVHELFFPFIQSFCHCDDTFKNRNEGTIRSYDKEIIDNTRLNSTVSRKTWKNDCSCSHTTCYSSKHHQSRFSKHSKSTQIQDRNAKDRLEKKSSHTTFSFPFSSSKKELQIDAETNTVNKSAIQRQMQTDDTCFKIGCEKLELCDICDTKRKSDSGIQHESNIHMEKSTKVRRKPRDEFDMFGKSVATQLRNLSLEAALELEKRIQEQITQERLQDKKNLKLVPRDITTDCLCDCSDCQILHKEMICSCGLPVIMIKNSCELGCGSNAVGTIRKTS